jgi:hypothetical protein
VKLSHVSVEGFYYILIPPRKMTRRLRVLF